MMELAVIIVFCWLFVKAVKLALKTAWGVTKIVASLLFVIAVPILAFCVIFAGGVLLLLPLALIGAAFSLLKACVT